MCDEIVIRRFAGVFVLLSVALAVWVSPLWLAFTAFVGLNLLQSSFTKFCPLERVLGWCGLAGCRSR
jgi:Inner membrane protein YgaP-like, transmembrane domain